MTSQTHPQEVPELVERLGETLFVLSGKLKVSGFLNKSEHHAIYEKAVAAFQALDKAALELQSPSPGGGGAATAMPGVPSTPLRDADKHVIADRAAKQIFDGFSWSTLQGPENLRARLNLCARQAVEDTIRALTPSHSGETGEVEYEVWQQDAFGDGDGMVAGSTSLADAKHYAAVYSQDAPAWVVEVTRRKLKTPDDGGLS